MQTQYSYMEFSKVKMEGVGGKKRNGETILYFNLKLFN